MSVQDSRWDHNQFMEKCDAALSGHDQTEFVVGKYLNKDDMIGAMRAKIATLRTALEGCISVAEGTYGPNPHMAIDAARRALKPDTAE